MNKDKIYQTKTKVYHPTQQRYNELNNKSIDDMDILELAEYFRILADLSND